MKINIKILIIACILISRISYSDVIIGNCDRNLGTVFNVNIDSNKLETKIGFIEIISECDSNSNLTHIYGKLFDSLLKKTSEESEKNHIVSDKGYLIFELNNNGQLIECKFWKPSRLKEFNILLQQFASEINLKYKDKIIIHCNDKTNKGNTYFEIPFKFQIVD